MIPQNIIEDLKFRCPVEDVISSYVTLKKAGNTLKGLCPFHSEKTPSFTVYPQDQHYYCFGCGAGGDVITFVMKTENLSYYDALRSLAKRSGITLPDDEVRVETGTSRTKILEMNLEAAKYFRSVLFDEKMGIPGRAYLAERQLSTTVAKHFGLGYAPDSFSALRDHLRSLGYKDEEMADANLCKKSEKSNSYYDVFRDRLIFPIIDNSGNVIAFGGRILDKEKSPQKYLNTSDTAAFKKSKNLFALNFARKNCAERIILCEGYMDVIAMHAAGFEYAVASLGTAFTADQARILKKYTKKVILAYDSDSAGQNATEKALRLLAEVGLEASVLVINGAKDPDEYIKTYGKEKFAELLDGSRTKFDFRMQAILKDKDVTIDADRIKAITELSDYISTIPSTVEREIYLARVAKEFGVSVESLTQDLKHTMNRGKKTAKKKMHDDLVREKMGFADRTNPDYAKNPKLGKMEEIVLGMILNMNEYASAPVDGVPLIEEDFSTEYCRKIFGYVKTCNESGAFNISMLAEVFTENEVSKAFSLMTERQMLTDNSPAVFADSVRRMREEKSKAENVSSGTDSILDILKSKE